MRIPRGRLLAAVVAATVALLAMPALAAAAAGDILIGDEGAFGTACGGEGCGGVIRVNPTTGARTTISENTGPVGGPSFQNPGGVVLTPGGDLLVADYGVFGGTDGRIIRVNLATGVRTAVSDNISPTGGPSFKDPFAVALAKNGDILVADFNTYGADGSVIRVDPTTGVRTTVSDNTHPATGPLFVDPFGIAVAKNGDILVAEGGSPGAVIRVKPTTGVRTTVSDNTHPAAGPDFDVPDGIAVAPNGDILVADADAFGGSSCGGLGCGGVIRVNPTTGARTTISENTSPSGGPSFFDPTGIVLAANGDILVADPVAFGGHGGVIRVNPTTGARTAISQNAGPAGAPLFGYPDGIAVVPTPAVVPACTSNSFTLGKAEPAKNGSATLPAAVPCPGKLDARDANDKAAAARKKRKKPKPLIKRATLTLTKAGTGTLTLKPSAAGRKVLRKSGKVKVRVRVTYTPTGGKAASKTKRVTLKQKRKRKRKH